MNPTMSPIDWAKRPLEKYAVFTGRAPRAEYWWYALGILIVLIVLMIVDGMLGLNGMFFGVYGPLALLFGVATFVPNISAVVRRLHDTNRSGWWILLYLVPWGLMVLNRLAGGRGLLFQGGLMGGALIGLTSLVALFVLLVFMVQSSMPGDNRYGPNPYGDGASAVAAE